MKIRKSFTMPDEYKPTDMSPPWMIIAYGEIGQKEADGDEDNPEIVEYHTATNMGPRPDSVPWCASFVSWCLEKCGIKSTRSAWARSYLLYGSPYFNKEGSICVFKRGLTSGHVGFFVKEDKNMIWILGGNQHDSVNVTAFPKADLLAVRYPPTNQLN